jgi:hypothetical protein
LVSGDLAFRQQAGSYGTFTWVTVASWRTALTSAPMRMSVLLSACLATTVLAAPAVSVPAEEAEAADDASYSAATQSTIDWITTMEANAAAQAAAEPPPAIESPSFPESATGIRRCAGADGTVVFTDKRCEDVGAVEATAPSAGNADTRIFVRHCARTREALVDGLREALDAQDANRVASYYHWTGMGNRAAYALMDRLHGFSQQPVVDVQLAMSGERRMSSLIEEPFSWWPTPGPVEPPRPRAPDLVRVDQMRSYDDASSEVTYFHLLANAGCWWIEF